MITLRMEVIKRCEIYKTYFFERCIIILQCIKVKICEPYRERKKNRSLRMIVDLSCLVCGQEVATCDQIDRIINRLGHFLDDDVDK